MLTINIIIYLYHLWDFLIKKNRERKTYAYTLSLSTENFGMEKVCMKSMYEWLTRGSKSRQQQKSNNLKERESFVLNVWMLKMPTTKIYASLLLIMWTCKTQQAWNQHMENTIVITSRQPQTNQKIVPFFRPHPNPLNQLFTRGRGRRE